MFEIFDHNWGLYAYLVKKEAAEALSKELFPRPGASCGAWLPRISSQVDYAISRHLITRWGYP